MIIGPDSDLVGQIRASMSGWQIVRVATNLEAQTAASGSAFDLIITGENTSAATDIDLLRQIRRIRLHTRMIILASGSTPEDVIASLREHAFGCFTAPFEPTSLAEMIQIAADGECWDDGIEVISATPAWVKLAARCDRRTAERLLQFFQEMVDLDPPEKEDVAYAFREMLLNAMEHGGHFDPQQYVEISYLRGRRAVACRVKDPGAGFSLEELKHAAVNNPPEDPTRHLLAREEQSLRPGGLGILLSQSMVDELIYSEKGNEVLLVKYLDPDRRASSSANGSSRG